MGRPYRFGFVRDGCLDDVNDGAQGGNTQLARSLEFGGDAALEKGLERSLRLRGVCIRYLSHIDLTAVRFDTSLYRLSTTLALKKSIKV